VLYNTTNRILVDYPPLPDIFSDFATKFRVREIISELRSVQGDHTVSISGSISRINVV
jgi:hypothetical protein